jgi:hypothetical protein
MHGEFLRLLFLQAHRETIGQRVLVQTRGILHGPEEQSRTRDG